MDLNEILIFFKILLGFGSFIVILLNWKKFDVSTYIKIQVFWDVVPC